MRGPVACRALVPLAAVLIAGHASVASAADKDWPGFLGPRGDAKSSATGLLLDWPEGGPPLVWHHELGEGYSMLSGAYVLLFAFFRHGDGERDPTAKWRVRDHADTWFDPTPNS